MFIEYNLSIVVAWIDLGNTGYTCGPSNCYGSQVFFVGEHCMDKELIIFVQM